MIIIADSEQIKTGGQDLQLSAHTHAFIFGGGKF